MINVVKLAKKHSSLSYSTARQDQSGLSKQEILSQAAG